MKILNSKQGKNEKTILTVEIDDGELLQSFLHGDTTQHH